MIKIKSKGRGYNLNEPYGVRDTMHILGITEAQLMKLVWEGKIKESLIRGKRAFFGYAIKEYKQKYDIQSE